MSNAKASKFRSFKNESSLTSYFRITKQLIAYYYHVVINNTTTTKGPIGNEGGIQILHRKIFGFLLS